MFLFFFSLCAKAQDSLRVDNEIEKETEVVLSKPKFGYLSYSEVIRLMPEYALAQEKLNLLQQRYDELAADNSSFDMYISESATGKLLNLFRILSYPSLIK